MSETGEDFYDYAGRERSFREALLGMVGRRLNRCRLQIVSPEINVVYLGFDDGAVAIQGDIGGELLRLVPISAAPGLGPLDADARISVRECEAAAPFLGRRIAQARVVGEAWNGHGVELAFEGLPDQTLVVSSVECEENKTDVHAALRVGTLKYIMVIGDDIQPAEGSSRAEPGQDPA